MGDRWATTSGWLVEVVHLAATPDHHDGEFFRVSYCGFHHALARTVAELEELLPLAELEPEALRADRTVARSCRGPVPHRPAARLGAPNREVPRSLRPRLAGRVAPARQPADQHEARSPQVAVLAPTWVVPPAGQLRTPHGRH